MLNQQLYTIDFVFVPAAASEKPKLTMTDRPTLYRDIQTGHLHPGILY